VSKDFYHAKDDAIPRVRLATLRACLLGVAVALLLVGSSIIVPHAWRFKWMESHVALAGEL